MTDISGCFDRIVAPIISLINQKNGCPQQAVEMHATNLELAQYHLKTKHGTSSSFYSHSRETPIHGNGQGAGDSPSQWCQQSALLFDIYAEDNTGATLTTPMGDNRVNVPLVAFADDTNLIGNDNDRTLDINGLIEKAQYAFSSWNNLLHATGHFMELEKCACYLSIWDFQKDGYAFTLDPTEFNQRVVIRDITGKMVEIPLLAATTSQKMLGVMRNPIGNQQDEVKRLREKSDRIATNLNATALSRVEAKLAYECFYIPAMRYSLLITSIHQLDLEKVQQHAIASLIAALGYNRHMPREVLYCAQRYQGIGIRHLFDIQGTDGIRLLLQELNFKDNKTNQILRNLLETIQLEAGIQQPILEDNQLLTYIEWGWIPSIRDFLLHIDARITNATRGLDVFRENDVLIMDSSIRASLTHKEQTLINRCRLRLQVECLSDITNPEGSHINPVWFRDNTDKPSRSIKRWPRQEDPGDEAWAIWKRFLQRAFLTTNSELLQPLGKWTKINTTRIHNAYVSPNHKQLYVSSNKHSWTVHDQTESRRRYNRYKLSQTSALTIPTSAIPIEINGTDRQGIITGKPPRLELQKVNPEQKSIQDALQWEREQHRLHDVSLVVEEAHIEQLFEHHAIIDTATDGSHDADSGIIAYGWVVAINETVVAEGFGPAQASPALAESFRAEAYGLYAATTFICLLRKYYAKPEQHYRWFFHIDSKTLITRMERYFGEKVHPNRRMIQILTSQTRLQKTSSAWRLNFSMSKVTKIDKSGQKI
jgi:hypothetical protein